VIGVAQHHDALVREEQQVGDAILRVLVLPLLRPGRTVKRHHPERRLQLVLLLGEVEEVAAETHVEGIGRREDL